MQTAVVILIVAIAAVYLAWVFYKGFKQKQSCACGCSGCGIADTCNPPSGHAHDIPMDRNHP
jgi:hypothetical protein